jgi:hypothetical protein
MRDDSVLSTFAAKIGSPAMREEAEAEPFDDYGAFGCIRGARDHVLMLELRRKDGSVTALGYAWLEQCDFEPGTITLKFVGQSVRIRGRNLNTELRQNVRLFEGLCRHRVSWVQEADEPTNLQSPRSAVVVEQIEFIE